jgi:hypothetical protein
MEEGRAPQRVDSASIGLKFPEIGLRAVRGLALFMSVGSGGWPPGLDIDAAEHNRKKDAM